MKKVLLGLSAVLFAVSSVMGMKETDETSPHMEHSSSSHVLSQTPKTKIRIRSNSDPVTNREIQAAIDKWSHLVPKETEDEANVTKKVNDALEDVVVHTAVSERKIAMTALVALICISANRSYANYAHMVFVTALSDCDDEERNKLGGMLAAIAGDRSGGGGAHPRFYWNEYEKGYYDSCSLSVEESVNY